MQNPQFKWATRSWCLFIIKIPFKWDKLFVQQGVDEIRWMISSRMTWFLRTPFARSTFPLNMMEIREILLGNKKLGWGMSHPPESSTSRRPVLVAEIDCWGSFCCEKRESPPSIKVTRKPNWSFRDSKARDWLRKGKVLAPLVRPT
jgi:hypothetical protein